MATQVSYPGVYIEEFTPAAPIEGVSTSVTAFIGLAERGPIGEPTLITSIDRYREVFGGPVLADIPYYLPLAVDGFFANGGRIAFVTRVSDAVAAHADLAAADGTVLAAARAFADGDAGLGGRVTIAHTSALATALTNAGVTPAVLSAHRTQLTVTGVDATRRVLTVADSTGLQEGDLVVVSRGNSKAPPTTVAEVTPTSVRLVAAAPAAPAAGEWNRVTTADAAAGTRRIRVDVPDGVSLRAAVPAGSVVSVVDGGTTEWHIASEVGTDTLTFARPVAATFAAATTRLTTAEFSLTVTDPEGKVRTSAGLSTSPLHPRWWGSVIDDPYLHVVLDDTALPAGDPRPVAADTALAGAVNENAAASWNAILTGMPQLLEKLAPIDEISLVVAPGVTETVPQQAIIEPLRAPVRSVRAARRHPHPRARRCARAARQPHRHARQGVRGAVLPVDHRVRPAAQGSSSPTRRRVTSRASTRRPTRRGACTRRPPTSGSRGPPAWSGSSPTPTRASSTSRA